MKRNLIQGRRRLVIGFALAIVPGVAAAQADCLRPDEERMQVAMNKAIASGSTAELPKLQKKVSGCTPYAVSFSSTLTMVAGGLTTTITGRGTLMIGLAADPSEPDYAVTSGPDDVTGTVVWSGVSMAGGPCTYGIVPSSPTPFTFWLGLTGGRSDLVVTPADHDLHMVTTKCGQGSGAPQPTPIFSSAWIMLHGQHGQASAAAMDPAAMMAMAERFKDKQPTQEEAMKMIQQMVPNAGQVVEAARENFKIKMTGTRHTIDRTVPLPGGGSIHEVTVVGVNRAGNPN